MSVISIECDTAAVALVVLAITAQATFLEMLEGAAPARLVL
jgi:hypothetical protein